TTSSSSCAGSRRAGKSQREVRPSAQCVVATRAGKCNKGWFGRGRSSARLERRPVTSEVVGSNPIGPAKINVFPLFHWVHEFEANRTNPQHLAREWAARPQLGGDRCKRASARTSRVARGKPADRQDPARLHSQPGYRRFRRYHQRRQGSPDGIEIAEQAVSSAYGMAGRNPHDGGRQDARGQAREAARDCGEGDAAEESTRPSDFQQAQGLSRRRASARSAEAQKRKRLIKTVSV